MPAWSDFTVGTPSDSRYMLLDAKSRILVAVGATSIQPVKLSPNGGAAQRR